MSCLCAVLAFAVVVFTAHVLGQETTTMDPRLMECLAIVQNKEKGDKVTQVRVYGGTPAKIGDFNFVVHIQTICYYSNVPNATTEDVKESYSQCSGSIISKRWVITAARCMTIEYLYLHHNKDHDGRYTLAEVLITIRAGNVDISEKTTPADKTVAPSEQLGEIIVHDQAVTFANNNPDNPVWKYDVALIEFPSELDYSEAIGSVDLMSGAMPFMFRAKCTALGFDSGPTYDNTVLGRESFNKLLSVRVAAGGTEFCRSLTQMEVWTDEQFLCTQNIADQRGLSTCSGDSGSPLLCGSIVVGVLSGSKHSRSCGHNAEDNDYTFTGKIDEWVTSKTNGQVMFRTSRGGHGARGDVTSLVAAATLAAVMLSDRPTISVCCLY